MIELNVARASLSIVKVVKRRPLAWYSRALTIRDIVKEAALL
ncbi:hypothetical protein [Paenibacillus glycanilyticus]|nr:hypothetical protein [Paenibacillus glycanilyticus]